MTGPEIANLKPIGGHRSVDFSFHFFTEGGEAALEPLDGLAQEILKRGVTSGNYLVVPLLGGPSVVVTVRT